MTNNQIKSPVISGLTGQTMEKISRNDAMRNGLQYFFTGKPCKRGEVFYRRTSNGHCCCEKCHVEQAKRQKNWQERNKETISKRMKGYYQDNKLTIEKHKELWRKENPEKIRAISAKRRAAIAKAVPSWFSEFDEFVIQEAYYLTRQRNKETGIDWQVDHMIPILSRKCCGLHCADNIQVIPAAMNLAKQNRMHLTSRLEWLK